MNKVQSDLKKAKRVVVKVGTSSLTYANGKLNLGNMERLTRVLSDLQNQGKEMILVSSGAIGVGTARLNLPERPKSTRGKQAAAAVGQSELMKMYSKMFDDYGHNVAQILLTNTLFKESKAVENCKNTFRELIKLGVIPIVNENDTVSIHEINAGKRNLFNENDTLAALVAKLVEADLLIILSDIDGLYDSNPRENPDSKIISVIKEVTPEIISAAGGAGTNFGTGGMATKVKAAKEAIDAGIHMVLANGENPAIIYDIINGTARGSIFVANKR